jgi:putative glutamate/gamma-aminobutyrate antiporter
MEVTKNKRVLSVFVLAMLNVSIMASLRNLPLVAHFGLEAIAYFLIVAFMFLVPCALVSAELATGWPKSGGVYVWVREALGERMGFLAIFMQWVHNVAWYPVIMTFVASTLAYVINPALAHNKVYILTVVLVGYWGMTLLNYLGIKTSSLFSTIGVIAGTILPGLLIIALGFSWVFEGNPSQIPFTLKSLVPKYDGINSLVFLSGLFLAFGGLEVSAGYASDVKDPQKNYPKSIILAALIVLFIFMLGSLSIALVIPKDQINIVSGLMDSFEQFFATYHLHGILPILAVLLIIGAIAEVNSWIIGPVKGLHATAVHGNMPPYFQKVNKNGTPVNLLFFQALIVTASSFVILQMPTVSASFWILTALSAQSYLVMYILMFIAAIRLKYSKPHVPRAYSVPYQKTGMWFFSSLGILASCLAIIVGFVPPESLEVGSLEFYVGFLLLSLAAMIGFPLILYCFKKPSWFNP